MHGWSRHDDPAEHPLLVADRLADPVMRAMWLGDIGLALGAVTELPPTIAERIAPPAPPPGSRAPETELRFEPTAAVEPPEPEAAASSVPSEAVSDGPQSSTSVVTVPDYGPLFETLIAETRNLQ